MLSDIETLVEYIFEHETSDFETWLLEDGRGPLDTEACTQDEWDSHMEEFQSLYANGLPSEAAEHRDWLAEHGTGHVYCAAIRAYDLRELMKLVEHALNMIPNTRINHDDAKDSYAVASKVGSFMRNRLPRKQK